MSLAEIIQMHPEYVGHKNNQIPVLIKFIDAAKDLSVQVHPSDEYAREHEIPYFGICLGMQIAVIEYARNVCGITGANSGEFDEQCADKVIDFMPGQSDEIDKGGTLRLGAYPCVISSGTTMEHCYGCLQISERHRHRYEFNNDYRERLQKAGLTLSGISVDKITTEIPFLGVLLKKNQDMESLFDVKNRKSNNSGYRWR